MRAAYWKAPRKIVICEEETPAPRAGEVLVKVGSCGVCGSDVHLYKDGRIGDTVIERPHILGHEFGGIVEAAGSKEYESLVGKKIAVEPAIPCMKCEICLDGNQNCCPNVLFCGLPPTAGAYREHMTFPGWLCVPVPDEMTYNQIAMFEPMAVAVHMLDLAKPGLGKTAAILGAGPIGQSVLEAAKRFAFKRLIVTDRLQYRLDIAKAAGATDIVNIEETDLAETVADLTGGQGVNYVFECTTDEKASAQAAQIASHGGKIFLAGINAADKTEFSFSHGRRKGLTVYCVRRSLRTLERTIHLVAAGAVDLERMITHKFSLDKLGDAFETVCDYRDGVVKAMIEIGQ